MIYLGSEETLVEIPAIDYIKDILNYDFTHGKELIPENGERDSLTEVILDKRLEKKNFLDIMRNFLLLEADNGESFMYLGRNYSLQIEVDSSVKKPEVKLYLK